MSSVNKVFLVGHTGKAAEIREVGNDKKAAFSLATSERFKRRDGEYVESTEWHSIECWGKLAEVAEKYILKGTMVYVEGKIRTEKYTDKNGEERYITKIIANTLQLLSKKEGGAAINDDDLPE
jgi:single-strand DNA-binding protein